MEVEFVICAAIASAELKGPLDYVHQDEADDCDIGLYTGNIASLFGLINFMSQGDNTPSGGFLPRLDESFRSKLLENIPSDQSVLLVTQVLRFVAKQAILIAENVEFMRGQGFNYDPSEEDSLVQQLQFGLAVVSQLAHSSDFSQRSDVIERRTDENFGKLLNEFFTYLIDMVCSIVHDAGDRVIFCRKLVNIIKDLAVNRYLKIQTVAAVVDYIVENRDLILAQQGQTILITQIGHLVELCIHLLHGMKMEMFASGQKLSTGLKRKRIGNKIAAGSLNFPATNLENMKRPERLDFRSRLEQWLEELLLATDHLTIVQSAFCRLIFNLQGEMQVIVYNLMEVN